MDIILSFIIDRESLRWFSRPINIIVTRSGDIINVRSDKLYSDNKEYKGRGLRKDRIIQLNDPGYGGIICSITAGISRGFNIIIIR